MTDPMPETRADFAKAISETELEEYLGDGLYASYDGFHVLLRVAGRPNRDVVGLEPEVLDSFEKYVAKLRARIKALPPYPKE